MVITGEKINAFNVFKGSVRKHVKASMSTLAETRQLTLSRRTASNSILIPKKVEEESQQTPLLICFRLGWYDDFIRTAEMKILSMLCRCMERQCGAILWPDRFAQGWLWETKATDTCEKVTMGCGCLCMLNRGWLTTSVNDSMTTASMVTENPIIPHTPHLSLSFFLINIHRIVHVSCCGKT